MIANTGQGLRHSERGVIKSFVHLIGIIDRKN